MRIRPRLMLAVTGAVSLVIPLMGLSAAQAATARQSSLPKYPVCIVTSTPQVVESGLGATTSSIADVIQVECKPKFSEQTVEISSPQLNGLCRGTLSWYSDLGTPATTGTGETFDVTLDDDGNATAVVWGGPSCAAGRALITADLTVAPYTTAKTHLVIEAPQSTPTGITAQPSSQVEDATYSGVDTVFQVEFPSVYSEDTVELSSPQLYDHCHGNITWVGPDETILGTGVKSVDVTLDDNGNAFAVALAGPSCATGKSQVTADLLAPGYTTLSTNFKILSPRVTVP